MLFLVADLVDPFGELLEYWVVERANFWRECGLGSKVEDANWSRERVIRVFKRDKTPPYCSRGSTWSDAFSVLVVFLPSAGGFALQNYASRGSSL